MLIFATTYVDSGDRVKLTEHWLALHQRINPDCDFLIVDSASPMLTAPPEGFTTHEASPAQRRAFLRFPDNVGHLSRGGRDGWGRAFCCGLDDAVARHYDYVVHIEGDSLFRLPVMPIVQQMARERTKVLSVPVKGMRAQESRWVETGLMFFSVAYLRSSRFTARYDWPHRRVMPTPERIIFDQLGADLKMADWKALRGDRNTITHLNVVSLDLDWVTHCHNDSWVYDRFAEAALRAPEEVAVSSIKVNLGCGDNRLAGWKNCDAEIDIEKPLPFADRSVDFMLAEHVVEHIEYYAALRFFQECRRVLKAGGVLRVAVPSLEFIWQRADADYCRFVARWAPEQTTRGAMHAILHAHGHKTAWTEALLAASLYYAGFDNVAPRTPGASPHGELVGVDGHARAIGERNNWVETAICEAS